LEKIEQQITKQVTERVMQEMSSVDPSSLFSQTEGSCAAVEPSKKNTHSHQ